MRDSPLDPVNLAFDKAGNLMVVSYAGNGLVYRFRPDATDSEITLLKAEAVAPRPGMAAILPTGDWRVNRGVFEQPYRHYVSPDGTTFLPAGQDFVSGALAWGVKNSALLRGFGLAKAVPGKPFYTTDEAEVSTWVGSVQPDGSVTDLKFFANQGGEGVAVGPDGNVYIAVGQIYAYSPAGKWIDTIEFPERPLQVVFRGKDGRTLFIPARTSLYAARIGGA